MIMINALKSAYGTKKDEVEEREGKTVTGVIE
jgi:hypothetical protein